MTDNFPIHNDETKLGIENCREIRIQCCCKLDLFCRQHVQCYKPFEAFEIPVDATQLVLDATKFVLEATKYVLGQIDATSHDT